MKKDNIAGIGVGSGKKESFFFCVLEYYSEEKRWFLKTCQQLKEFQYPETEDSILSWVKEFEIENLVVDFPLTKPPCYTCELDCPGSNVCPVPEVVAAREKISDYLKSDAKFYAEEPKKYEEERVKQEKEGVKKGSKVLSKSFKRKLKKGFVPYWNRIVDYKVWFEFYDDLLKHFNVSFDSFGNENLIQILRFNYLKRHFKSDMKLYEVSYHICLLQLLKCGIIKEQNLSDMRHLETAVLGRMDILKAVEEKLDVFVYQNDKEVMIKNPRAFQSFIITLAGSTLISDKLKANFLDDEKSFFYPVF